jgi:hypothetical protein
VDGFLCFAADCGQPTADGFPRFAADCGQPTADVLLCFAVDGRRWTVDVFMCFATDCGRSTADGFFPIHLANPPPLPYFPVSLSQDLEVSHKDWNYGCRHTYHCLPRVLRRCECPGEVPAEATDRRPWTGLMCFAADRRPRTFCCVLRWTVDGGPWTCLCVLPRTADGRPRTDLHPRPPTLSSELKNASGSTNSAI